MIKCITIFRWGDKLLKIRGRAVRLISPFSVSPPFDVGLLLIRSHAARRRAVHLMHNSTNGEQRWAGRPLTVGSLLPALRLEGYYTFFFFLFAEVHCYSAREPCGSCRSLRQRGPNHSGAFSISVTSAARWKVSSSGTVIGPKPRQERQSGTARQSAKCSPGPFSRWWTASPARREAGWGRSRGWSDGGVAKAAAFDAFVSLFSHWTRSQNYHLKGSMAKWNFHRILRNDILCLSQHVSFLTHGPIITTIINK